MQDGIRNFFPQAQGAFTAGLGQQLGQVGGRGPYIGAPAMTSAAPAQQQQHFGLQGAGLQQLRFVGVPGAGQMAGHPLEGLNAAQLNPQLTAQSRLLAGMRAGAVGNPAAAAAAAAAAGQNPQLLQQLQQQQQQQRQQQFAAAQQFGVNLGGANTLGGLAMAGQHPLGGRVGQPDILNLLQQGNLKQGGLGAVNLNAAQAQAAQGQAAAAAAMLANRGLGGVGVGFGGGAGAGAPGGAAGLVGQLQQAAAAAAANAGGIGQGGAGGESDAGPSFAAEEFPALGAGAGGARPSSGTPAGKVGDSYASLALRRQAAGAGGGVGPVGGAGGAAGVVGGGAQSIDFSIQNESDFPALGGGAAGGAGGPGPADAVKRFGGVLGGVVGGEAGAAGAAGPGAGREGGEGAAGGAGVAGMNGSAAAAAAAGDRYGLLGLLQVIRMTDQDLTMLALGTDLTSLGLNLNSPEQLYKSMVSPLSDAPIRREQEFEVGRGGLTAVLLGCVRTFSCFTWCATGWVRSLTRMWCVPRAGLHVLQVAFAVGGARLAAVVTCCRMYRCKPSAY